MVEVSPEVAFLASLGVPEGWTDSSHDCDVQLSQIYPWMNGLEASSLSRHCMSAQGRKAHSVLSCFSGILGLELGMAAWAPD